MTKGNGRRKNPDETGPRDRRTLIPGFDPAMLESLDDEVTRASPFQSSAYAIIVQEGSLEPKSGRLREESGFEPIVRGHLAQPDPREEAPPLSDTPPALPSVSEATVEWVADGDIETIGREMYGSYLASDFPAALVLAERVLAKEPAHAFAQLVALQCREKLGSPPVSQTLRPSSVLRLKFAELERQSSHLDARTSFVLGHIDGVSDAATVAALTGLPKNEALNRLHELLHLGVLEVVSF
jgi:hypothetical protein